MVVNFEDLFVNVLVRERLAIALIVASSRVSIGRLLVLCGSLNVPLVLNHWRFAIRVQLVDTGARHARRVHLLVVRCRLLEESHGTENDRKDNEDSKVDNSLVDLNAKLAHLQVLPQDVGGLRSINNFHLLVLADDWIVVAVRRAVLVVLAVVLHGSLLGLLRRERDECADRCVKTLHVIFDELIDLLVARVDLLVISIHADQLSSRHQLLDDSTVFVGEANGCNLDLVRWRKVKHFVRFFILDDLSAALDNGCSAARQVSLEFPDEFLEHALLFLTVSHQLCVVLFERVEPGGGDVDADGVVGSRARGHVVLL